MSDIYEFIYSYNNASYSIMDTGEIHELLKNNSAFLEDYIKKNTSAPVLLSINEVENTGGLNSLEHNNNVVEQNFTWSTKSTKLFLEAYSERKSQFRNPKIKKKRLWQEIAQTLKIHGYTNIDEEILDRKMRNMKRSYKTIKENNKKSSTGRGRVSWEYFDIFEDIFANDKTINPSTLESTINVQETIDPYLSTTELSTDQLFTIVNENSSTSNTPTINESTPLITQLSDITNNVQNVLPETCLDSPSTSNSSTPISMKNKYRSSLYNQRKKQIELEQKRIQAINDLKESLEESNKIQKERNELIKELLLSQLQQQAK